MGNLEILPQIKAIESYGLASNPLENKRGYIGVSICSHFYSKRNIKAIIEWAADNFNEFLFLVADEPQSYTFMASKGLGYEDSYERAMKIGDEKFISIQRLIESSGHKNITIDRWKDVAHNKEFLSVQSKIRECYRTDVYFKNDILKQVQLRNEHLTTEYEFSMIEASNFDTAALYVLNEISVMIFLQEISDKTFPIQIYPFRMPPALVGLYENIYCNEIKLNKDKSGYIQIDVDE